MQTQDDFWLEGLKACEQGQSRDANPYSDEESKVDQAYNWFMGWDTAKAVLNSLPNGHTAHVV